MMRRKIYLREMFNPKSLKKRRTLKIKTRRNTLIRKVEALRLEMVDLIH